MKRLFYLSDVHLWNKTYSVWIFFLFFVINYCKDEKRMTFNYNFKNIHI